MYYITTSRPYTNSDPHLGTVIDPIYADVYARFKRQISHEQVFFSMGTDEHSFKILAAAKDKKIDVSDYVNKIYSKYGDVYKDLNINWDNFIQSSDKKHHFVANLVWKKLINSGFIYKKDYEGLYCIGCEDYYSPSQLINGKCPIHTNLEIKKLSEENYFFKLSLFKKQLVKYLNIVKVNDRSVIKEMINFAEDLQDISISRSIKRLNDEAWGVIIDNSPDQVMYVWFEALITYITPIVPDELFENYLYSDDDIKITIVEEIWQIIKESLPQNLQVIGRDNSKFHLIIWASILIALDLPPISSILIHGMITDSFGRKFAKSLNNGFPYESFKSIVGTEGVRFFVLACFNSEGDSNFNLENIISTYNSYLSNNLGNLVNRLSNLIANYLNGELELNEFETNLCSFKIDLNFESVINNLEELKPDYSFKDLFQQIDKINSFLEQTKPWILGKELETNRDQIKQILQVSVYSLLKINQILSIFLPQTSEKLYEIFNSNKIVKSEPLFKRLEHKEINT
jgi:methionyl-tRNA synthetase